MTTTSVDAAPLAVPNFSFESPNVGEFGFTVDNWTVTTPGSSGGIVDGSIGFGAPPQTNQFLFLQLPNFGGPNPSSATSNAAGIGPAMAGTYTLTVAGGRRSDGQTTSGSYVIDLLAGGTVIGTQTVNDPLNTYAPGSWNDIVAVANLTPDNLAIGQDLQIRLTAVAGVANNQQGQFDNVRLDFAALVVPEPASIACWMALTAVACAAVFSHRVRHRRCV